jgi:NAD-dependent dihydropyrimidine dehydrogenase PreA subunit
MAKVLKATFKENCIGCELCVYEVQRQLGKVGLEGSPVRIFRERHGGKFSYAIDIDHKVNKLDVEKIVRVCPTMVFSIEDTEEISDDLTK